MDGTLVDSGEAHWLAWREVLAREGVSVTHGQFLATFGWRNAEILERWMGPDAGPERIARVGEAKEEAYRERVRKEGVEPLPGAEACVRALRSAGWRQAITSSAPRANIEVVLDALGFRGLVDEHLGAEDVRRGKPDPELFLRAAERLDVPPGRCVVVEDAGAGVEGARRAGMACIGVGGEGVRAADVVVDSLADLALAAFASLVEAR
jgi:beta-phosphoglucomutase